MKQIELSLIGKYRSELMGIAAVGIILCHAGPRGVNLGFLQPVFNLGQLGNALFFLLSGYGLFFSLQKNDFKFGSLVLWYKKRFIRIFIPYLIWCIPFFVYQIVKYPGTDWIEWLYAFSLLSYWDGSGGVAWFLSVLIFIYLCSPILYIALNFQKRVLRNFIFITVILLVCFFLFPANNTLSLLCRNMPNFICFLLGMLLGHFSSEGGKIGVCYFALFGIICYSLHFLNVYRTGSDMFHFGTCMFVLPWLILIFEKIRVKLSVLNKIGQISLESYLTNGGLPRVVALIPWSGVASNWNNGNYLGYGIVIVCGLFLAWVIHKLSAFIICRI